MDRSITGTDDMELGGTIIKNTSKACRTVSNIPEESTVALFEDMEPQNILETMLISQMTAAHSHCINLFQQAGDSTLHEVQMERLKQAQKLMRTFAHSMETLEKTRRRGNQTMKVEHVNINSGGRAIVGPVGDRGKE